MKGYVNRAIMNTSINILIVEERDLLREKIAGILSREENITMVIQVSSYSKLKTVMEETVPDLILGDFFEFDRFHKKTGITTADLCSDTNILLYTDEDERLSRNEMDHCGVRRVFDVRRVQQEVISFLQDIKQKKSKQS